MNKVIGSAVVAALLSVGAVSMAIGQTTSPSANPPSVSAPAQKSGHHWFGHKSASERMENRLNKMKVELKITPAEQAQWDAYANFMRKTAQGPKQSRAARSSHEQRPNAIAGLDQAQAGQAKAATWLNELSAVEKPLYASLSPEQQKVADKVLSRNLRRMGERMAFGYGRHHHEGFRMG